jgi:phosphoserine phosphatase
VKTGFSERAFSNFDLVCLDDRVDVVGAAVHADDDVYALGLRTAYAAASGRPIGPERWLLYELVHLWDLQRQALADPETVRRRKSRAVRRYLADLLLADVAPATTGPVVALDVDGVLETDVWGFDAPTPATAACLRALHAHGHRPVVVTGRSLSDVVELCERYGLAGGAAEYGSVCYDRASGVTVPVVDLAGVGLLDRFRASLQRRDDLHVDLHHRYSVRVSAVAAPGRLRGPAPETLPLPPGLVAVPGDRQTDVVVAGTDKARGGEVLLRMLGADRPLLAVGDTAADVPMLTWAARSVVPAHAAASARAAAGRTARRPYQSGLEDAITELLGHRPGGCRTCAPPPLPTDARLLLALLRVPEGGRAQAVARTLPLLVRLARSRRDGEERG